MKPIFTFVITLLFVSSNCFQKAAIKLPVLVLRPEFTAPNFVNILLAA
ncbi:MAG: hypothetical protein AAF599_10365 [Bacteroidota bacterium]